jgi:2-isopropylmalate synthase
MKNIKFQDTSLRDGEQTPGVAYSLEDKMLITEKLCKLNLNSIELGFPAASSDEAEIVKRISLKYKDYNNIFCVFSRAIESDIDIAYESIKAASNKRIQIVAPASELHIKYSTNKDKNALLEDVKNTIKFAKRKFKDIQFTAQDAPRADIIFLKELVSTAVENGARTICLPDTAGFCLPNEYSKLISSIKHLLRKDEISISAHCHNDLGLATINTIAAIEAGADQVECTINGIGERAGNTPMEEVAAIMNLKYKDEYTNDIKLKYFKDTSFTLGNIIGIKPHVNKPIFGKNAFLHSSGMHQKAIINNKETFEVINAEKFGIEGGKISIGKLSGRAGIKKYLEEINIILDKEELKKLMILIKKEAINIKQFDENNIQRILRKLKN